VALFAITVATAMTTGLSQFSPLSWLGRLRTFYFAPAYGWHWPFPNRYARKRIQNGGAGEALEITDNCCRIGGFVDCRSGTAANLTISQTNIARRNCEGKSSLNSEERELPTSSERGKIDRF